MKQKILKDFDNQRIVYLELEEKIKQLIISLLKEEKLTIHAIESRVKERESLAKKIDKKQDKYSGLQEITDTLGLRIITYFEDDVDKVANVIKKEFDLDEENSIDKREKNFDSFGYSSLHYVVKLKETRASLPEYARFNDITFELQIRSILQHAWAEVEHDIGYKSVIEIPKKMRRDFSRVASLLELADIEFIRIKEGINQYSQEIKEKITSQDLNIPIDNITLKEFLLRSSIIDEIENNLLDNLNFSDLKWKDETLEGRVNQISFFEIKTIKELENTIEIRKSLIVKFAEKWFKMMPIDKLEKKSMPLGISIFYLCYVLACETEDLDQVSEYLKHMNMELNDQSGIAAKLMDVYKQIKE